MVSKSSCQASLRSKSKEDRDACKIPYGDWFEYVSSAHYFAEFVSIVQVDNLHIHVESRMSSICLISMSLLCRVEELHVHVECRMSLIQFSFQGDACSRCHFVEFVCMIK